LLQFLVSFHLLSFLGSCQLARRRIAASARDALPPADDKLTMELHIQE
jgi:hypothetical protein